MSGRAKNIVNLFSGPSRITEVMDGPWRDITVDTVGETPVTLTSDAVEHAGFVLGGVLTGVTGSGESFTLRKGSAFAIPQGGSLTLTSVSNATYLHVVLAVH